MIDEPLCKAIQSLPKLQQLKQECWATVNSGVGMILFSIGAELHVYSNWFNFIYF